MIDKLKTWIKKQTHAERERKIQDLKNKRLKDGKARKNESTAKAKKKKKKKKKEKKKRKLKTNWKNKEIKS